MNIRAAVLVALLAWSVGCADPSMPGKAPAPQEDDNHGSSLDWFLLRQLRNQQAASPCDLIVTAEQGKNVVPTLRFTLRNPGDREWRFENQLPPWEWCGAEGPELLVVDASGNVLDTIHPPCSPPMGLTVNISPRTSVSGDLDLTFVVADLDAALQRGPVAVAWTYRFTGPEQRECLATGALALSQAKP